MGFGFVKLLLVSAACMAIASHAAAPFTETFALGSNGWINANGGLESGSWSITGALAQRDFSASGGGPPPGTALLIASNSAAAGAFAGDYSSSAVFLVGFDFRYFEAFNIPPQQLSLLLTCGTNTLQHDFKTPNLTGVTLTTGQWYSLRATLQSPGLGRWSINGEPVNNSPLDLMEACLTNVDSLAIVLARGSNRSQSYQVDNVFLDRIPAAEAVSASSDSVAVAWKDLRTNLSFRAEATTSATSSIWSALGTFVATGSTYTVIDTNVPSDGLRAYRLIIE